MTFFLFNCALSLFFTVNVYIILGRYKQIIISSCIECHERLNKHASTLEFNLAPLLLLINKCTFEYYTGRFFIRGAIKTKATHQRNGKHHGPHCVYYNMHLHIIITILLSKVHVYTSRPFIEINSIYTYMDIGMFWEIVMIIRNLSTSSCMF